MRVDEYLLQTNQSEMSAKIRGERPGVEIKGLIAVCRSEAVPFAPDVELWCKWSLQASALEITKKMIVQKTRWLRTYDTSPAGIVDPPAVLRMPDETSRQSALSGLARDLQQARLIADGFEGVQ